jgi:hypothetical protein
MFRTMQRVSLVASLCFGMGCAESGDDDDDGSNGEPDAAQPATVDAGAQQSDAGTPSDGGSTSMGGPLLPWKQGNTWTYRVTGGGEQASKVTTVEALEPIGGTGPNAGKMAFKVVTKKGMLDQTISWQGIEGDSVVRYREQSFSAMSGQLELEEHWAPGKLHVSWKPEHTKAGATWIDIYQETKTPVGAAAESKEARDVWKVDAVDQTVTVPAGTFKAIVLMKSGGTSQKTYWYVPGVGKVKETGGQTEELMSYQVAP